MADDPRALAFDAAAPERERTDALTELAKAYATGEGILPADLVTQLQRDIDMLKASKVLPFPVDRARPPASQGMQSIALDDLSIAKQGDFYDPPSALSPEVARRMVDQTPILSAILMTRQRQVARFCAPSEDGGLGFTIRHVDLKHELAEEEQASIERLTAFFRHSGWEWNPKKRKGLRRDPFPTLMAKLVRDTLTLDRAAIEVEHKRDRSQGIDGIYAVDGATIRLCSEEGFRGDTSIHALQVINGRIVTAYDHETLIYEARNPRADVRFGDYGFSELEVLVQTVTGFLNAMTLNIAGFEKNSIPKGMLHLMGEYGTDELASFKRYWQAMMRGASNAWQLPVMVSKDPAGKAQFERFGVDFNEMYFSKWMTFLTSIACAVYSMDPSEINFESFTNGASSLSGDDTAEKLAASKDKGLRPLLSHFETLFSDYIVADFGPQYVFRWVGLDPKDEARDWEGQKLVLTVNELRARMGEEPHENDMLGNAPLNPSLMGLYQQATNPQGGDFGASGDFGAPEDGGEDGGDGGDPDAQGDDPEAQEEPPAEGDGAEPQADPQAPGDFGKALPTIYRLEP